MQLSVRSAYDPQPNALTLALNARLAAGLEVLDLTASNPTVVGVPYDEATVRAALAGGEALMRYAPKPFGLSAARAAAAASFPGQVAPARVVLTASTSEAYGHLFKVLCDPGDEVLVPQPSYPLFEQLARYEGVRLRPYPLGYDGRWYVETDAVRRAITPRTRAVLVVSPNNPTGHYLKAEELARLQALGLPILCDEVFASYPLEPDGVGGQARVPTVATAMEGLTVALSGLSKLAGLPQMKAGWMAIGGAPKLADALLERLELLADTYLSIGAPVQHALPALLAQRGPTVAAILSRAQRNLATLQAALQGSALTPRRVEGGWYAVVDVPRVRTEEAWVLGALEVGVRVQPGYFYDFPREAAVVLSLLTRPEVFAEGVRRLRRYVDDAL